MKIAIVKLCFFAGIVAAAQVHVLACSVSFPPLRKDFRWADRIFTGEVVEIVDKPDTFPKTTDTRPVFGIVKFRVEKEWKGSHETEISLPSDVGGSICPGDFDSYKKGEKYLVFAKRNYAPYVMSAKFHLAKDKMRRLDSFWFRTWSRIYPF